MTVQEFIDYCKKFDSNTEIKFQFNRPGQLPVGGVMYDNQEGKFRLEYVTEPEVCSFSLKTLHDTVEITDIELLYIKI